MMQSAAMLVFRASYINPLVVGMWNNDGVWRLHTHVQLVARTARNTDARTTRRLRYTLCVVVV